MTVFIVMGCEQYGPSWIEEVFASRGAAEIHASKLNEEAVDDGLDHSHFYVTERDVIV